MKEICAVRCRWIITLAIMLVCLFVFQKGLAVNQRQINELEKYDSKTLLSKANSFGETRHMADSGLLCLYVVSNRYNERLAEKDKKYCLEADNQMAYVLAMTYSNYSEAFEYLRKAEEISIELGDTSMMTLYNKGVIYHLAEKQTGIKDFFLQAVQSYKLALNKSIEEHNWTMADNIMSNIIEIYDSHGQLSSIAGLVAKYQRSMPSGNTFVRQYNKLLWEGLENMNAARYLDAERIFLKQMSMTQGSKQLIRYHLNTMIDLVRLYSKTGEQQKMINIANNAIAISEKTGLKDCLIEFYKALYEYYNSQKDVQKANKYFLLYSKTREDVYSSMMTANLGSQKIMDELTKTKQDMQIVAERDYWQRILLIIFSVFLIVSIIGCTVILKMHKHLKKDYNQLYDNNVKLIQTEKEALIERKKLEEEISRLQGQSKTQTEDDTNIEDVTKKRVHAKIKFPIGAEECKRLYSGLKDLLEDVSIISNPDISLDYCATKLNTKSRYLSYIINEESGGTFRQLLNENRIKEACRRINNVAEYGNLTIEAIAESVGFRNRSHFAVIFAKYTGLKPSMYQKIAKERHHKEDGDRN